MKEHLLRGLAMILAVASMAFVLAFGGDLTGSGLEPGADAPRDFFAERTRDVLDPVSTQAAQDAALAEIPDQYRRVQETEESIETAIDAVFAFAAGNVSRDARPLPSTDLAASTTTTASTIAEDTTTTTVAEGETTTTTTEVEIVEDAVVIGRVFVDVDADGVYVEEAEMFDVSEQGLADIEIQVEAGGLIYSATTDSDGAFQVTVPSGPVTAAIQSATGAFPVGFVYSTDTFIQEAECSADSTCRLLDIGVTPNIKSVDEQIGDLRGQYAFLGDETLLTLSRISSGDVLRDALGEETRLQEVNNAAIVRVRQIFETGIQDQSELDTARNNVVRNPPFVVLADGTRDNEASAAAAEIISRQLQVTEEIDEEATNQARANALAQVEDVFVTYEAGDLIVRSGDTLSEMDIEAIDVTGAITGRTLRRAALVGVLTVLVGSLGFYLSRFRPQFWHSPRMVVLWATLLVLSAASVRLAIEVEPRTGTYYVLPAVAFGYLAAVLFDNRMGTLMALAMAIIAAIGTEEAGVAVFGLLATLAPIGLVSKVSTRRAFRNSVVVSSFFVAAIAAAATWFFDTAVNDAPIETVGLATAWAFGAALVAALVALAAMPFFESVFDITTTLRLLELTDRNHEALQVLQEKAFGTFNHSLMVGTLADSAAKAIGANNLLARAAAYFHDLGKTENPTYFIENQFGISNPHDEIAPEESARIVRAHVTDGMNLATRYKIPSEVAEGIEAHHGDAIMRYFYEKARQLHGEDNVDPNDFRHAGHKPRSREMAIVMMADSVEGACRAVFGDEEPKAESIAKVVNRVIDEKVADGQLNDSDLTLAELTTVRRAFIDALVGHYHQRIQYPNFPGS